MLPLILLLSSACSSPTQTLNRACAIPAAEAKVLEPSLAVEPNPTFVMNVTGYTSRREETDDTPCIAADTTNICERYARGESICASRKFPFGTRLKIDGLGTCTVADRPHRKYSDRIDWYFGNDLAAVDVFEKKRLIVEVLP